MPISAAENSALNVRESPEFPRLTGNPHSVVT